VLTIYGEGSSVVVPLLLHVHDFPGIVRLVAIVPLFL